MSWHDSVVVFVTLKDLIPSALYIDIRFPNKSITYANLVYDLRPLKTETHRVRLMIGGDRLNYNYNTASSTTNLLKTKVLLNSTISDAHKGARFLRSLHKTLVTSEWHKVPARDCYRPVAPSARFQKGAWFLSFVQKYCKQANAPSAWFP